MGVTDYLLFAVLGTRDEINGLHMTNIDFVSQDIRKNNLCNVSEKSMSLYGGLIAASVRTFSSGIHPNYRLLGRH